MSDAGSDARSPLDPERDKQRFSIEVAPVGDRLIVTITDLAEKIAPSCTVYRSPTHSDVQPSASLGIPDENRVVRIALAGTGTVVEIETEPNWASY